MIINNNNEITEVYYKGHKIQQIVACNHQVYNNPSPPPTPTGMTGLKVSGTTTIYGNFSKECNNNELIPHDIEVPSYSAVTKLEVGVCVNIIGYNTLLGEPNCNEIILPSTIQWIRDYSFLAGDTSIQRLIIYATTPPRFQNYVEDEWYDIFGYRYPSSAAPEGFKIYVPAASLNAYKTADGWSHMEDYFVAI